MRFILLFISILLFCNLTLFIEGYSYIGYAVVISLLLIDKMNEKGLNIFNYSVLFGAVILSLLNIVREVFFKVGIFEIFDPTKVNYISLIALIYLLISIISGILWYKRKNQSIGC